MNAQEKWKEIWRVRDQWQSPRHWMRKVRREAALERRIAALERENEALQERVWQLESRLPNYDDGVRISQPDDYNERAWEWEKEYYLQYYLRGMHR